MSEQVSRGSAGEYQADERQVSRGSAGEYQADEATINTMTLTLSQQSHREVNL